VSVGEFSPLLPACGFRQLDRAQGFTRLWLLPWLGVPNSNGLGWLSDLIDVVIIIVLWLSIFFTFPNMVLFMTIVASLAVIRIIKTIVIRVLSAVTAIFTEDEVIVKGRKGTLTIPRSVVTSSNILCTERRLGFKLRVTYGSVDYTIPLGRWGSIIGWLVG